MKHVRCPHCGFVCSKGETNIGKQRWYCKECRSTFSLSFDQTTRKFKIFLQWLFSKNIQRIYLEVCFRRKTAKFWNI